MDFTTGADTAHLGSVTAERFATRLDQRGFKVVTQGVVGTLLSLERQRQLLGCADDSTDCVAEATYRVSTPCLLRKAPATSACESFALDGGTWGLVWEAKTAVERRQVEGCIHVIARRVDGGTLVLCATCGAFSRAIVRFDDADESDAGPTAQLLVTLDGDGRDGGPLESFRGLAFAPD